MSGGASAGAVRPRVGLIVPPAAHEVPPEATGMYGQAVDFTAVGLGLERLTPQGYDSVLPRIADAARTLRERGVAAVALMGTSLSFYRGAAFNASMTQTLTQACSLPVTTMSTAVTQALRALGAQRVAVATAYGQVVNDRLVSFLEEEGFAPGTVAALHIEDVNRVFTVSDADLERIATQALQDTPGADALLISCGGLRTLTVAADLERHLGLPVVTSATAGPWAAVRLVGHSGHAPGCGRLFEPVLST